MARQNIFDDPVFFEGYKRIREREDNANILFEIPALFSLLPDLSGKTVLDLGCGFGEHCKAFVSRGAERVVGIDISEKMLAAARRENSDPAIEYMQMPIEDLDRLDGSFDVVVSSLAFHYVEDFPAVVKKIRDKMNAGGLFVFSQEHPLTTAYGGGDRWTKDEDGNKLYVNLSDYGREGERESTWFVDGIRKYHRMFSTIVNTLTDAGFTIERVIEPLPDDDLLRRYPAHKDLFHKPDFLLIKARRA